MKTRLITALRTAAKALEEGTFSYNWEKPESCNCGVLASTLMHKSSSELAKMIPKSGRQVLSWESLVQQHCPVTGISEVEVLRVLQEAGMTARDIVHLEHLSDPVVCRRTRFQMGNLKSDGRVVPIYTDSVEEEVPKGILEILFTRGPKTRVREITLGAFKSKQHTILYMRAWADLLTEQGQDDQVVTSQAKQTALK